MFGNNSSEFTTGCNTPSRIMKLDLTAPSIKGVKNNKVYKKPITVKFSDASGIKKATLNNKNIKSGTKVSKKGTYILKVTDKIGNTKKIKFTIK